MSGMVAASFIEDAGGSIHYELCTLWVADAELVAVTLVLLRIGLCRGQIMFHQLEIVTVVAKTVNTTIAIVNAKFGPGWNPACELAARRENTSNCVLPALTLCLEPVVVLPCLSCICGSIGDILRAVIPLYSSSCIVLCFP